MTSVISVSLFPLFDMLNTFGLVTCKIYRIANAKNCGASRDAAFLVNTSRKIQQIPAVVCAVVCTASLSVQSVTTAPVVPGHLEENENTRIPRNDDLANTYQDDVNTAVLIRSQANGSLSVTLDVSYSATSHNSALIHVKLDFGVQVLN